MHRLLQFCLVILAILPAWAQHRTVALTFDDLPLAAAGTSDSLTPAQRLKETQSINRAILAALRRHHAWAIAFVNEKKVVSDGYTNENRAILRRWINQGNELGNHTYSHADFSKISMESFQKEVIDGETSIRPMMTEAGKPLRYFRFPYNHTGETAEKHAAAAAFLEQHGYEVASCTVDTSDWVFAHAYRLMLDRHDAKSAKRLQADYLEYTRQEIEYYSRLHAQIFGHEIPHVMVLHANRLNADTIEPVLIIFEKMGYSFVTLQQAQADPAYKSPDAYIVDAGPMWGYRWAAQLNIKVNGRLEPEVPAWVTVYQ